jgi:23S rRNA (pseudouridine1915-N3)-methyltransferase
VKLRVAWIGKTKERPIQSLTVEYLKRLTHYVPTESLEVPSEQSLAKQLGRSGTVFVALDSAGRQLSSEELAQFVADHQNRGTQALLFAIGPANGWSEETLRAAQTKLSLGRITLPHELARVVLLEQLYRAYTILKGHPYHLGH